MKLLLEIYCGVPNYMWSICIYIYCLVKWICFVFSRDRLTSFVPKYIDI